MKRFLLVLVIGVTFNGVVTEICPTTPEPPINAHMQCIFSGQCTFTCKDNYRFPNGKRELTVICKNRKWVDSDTESEKIAPCEATCSPPCLNNGICVAPNQCKCVGNYMRPNCKHMNAPCKTRPLIPLNSKRSCKGFTCTFTCTDGQSFPDGSTKAVSICEGGIWVPENPDWKSMPDCKPMCTPRCQNRGTCLMYNVCQCTEQFRGTQCQYSSDVCSGRNLNFNGGYRCVGDDESYKCSLSCPEKSKFNIKPAVSYICAYNTGEFKMEALPTCIFENNMEAVPVYRTSENKLKEKKVTVLYNNVSKVVQTGEYVKYDEFKVVAQKVVQATPGTCFTWGGSHYNTFDGKIYSVDSDCEQILVKNAYEDTFSVTTVNTQCKEKSKGCSKIIKINIYGQEYILKTTDKGIPILVLPNRILSIPARLDTIKIDRDEKFVTVHLDLVGAKLKWDGEQFIQVDVGAEMWQNIAGMCGSLDGDAENDIITEDLNKPDNLKEFARSWSVYNEDECGDPIDTHNCTKDPHKLNKGQQFCKKILSSPKFSACHKLINPSSLIDACTWDYCGCNNTDVEECACQTLNIYVKMCTNKGITNLGHWRDSNTCPLKCTNGKIYMTCIPKEEQPTCWNSPHPGHNSSNTHHGHNSSNTDCEEGCYCPIDKVLYQGNCIPKSHCPCHWLGKEYRPGHVLYKECETCTCSHGQWSCIPKNCNGTCSCSGDPHYTTFDGKKFNFMGKCNYYFLKTPTFSIEGENIACYGPGASCNNALIIKLFGQKIKLLQKKAVQVNDETINSLPHYLPGATIKMQTSRQVGVILFNGVKVLFDGPSYLVYVIVPPSFKNKTQGLCGTWNGNPSDDFLTPDGIIATNANDFGNSWITHERCVAAKPEIPTNPCDNKKNKAFAQKHCLKLKSNLFKHCHFAVDVKTYYDDCLFDMCACGATGDTSCMCAIISTYAQKCANAGIVIDWRENAPECKETCPAGQIYQTCGNPCTRSCSDLTDEKCGDACSEGCYCPAGTSLDDKDACVSINKCKCKYNGLELPSGHKEIRVNNDKYDLCTCASARWDCRAATDDEIMKYPKPNGANSKCDAAKNLIYTNCESHEPRTCKNKKEVDMPKLPPSCKPGCECKMGYVFDTYSEKCSKPADCTCYHDGKLYKENESIKNGCNLCKCESTKWVCSEAECTGKCSVWGESHYKTFDGKTYNFKGQCEYTFVEGVQNNNNKFEITTQNWFCEDAGVYCKKTIRVFITLGHQSESIFLDNTSKKAQHDLFTVNIKEPFVILESIDMGFTIQWDKMSRVYANVDSRWKNKLRGLCGNYNDNEIDDFKTWSGVSEIHPDIFAASWKQGFCFEFDEPNDQPDPNENKETEKCNVLKSDVFKHCHLKVPVDIYFENCVQDSYFSNHKHHENICATIAAYSDECGKLGLQTPWRTNQICPMKCEENKRYSPCVSKNSHETCDNLFKTKTYDDKVCVEGCESKPCLPNFVYADSDLINCIPKHECKPFCTNIGGKTYYEGNLMHEDKCFRSFCSHGKEIMSGYKCDLHDEPKTEICTKGGWTTWQKYNTAIVTKNVCKAIDVDCRTIDSHINYKQIGLKVECSLKNGLVCHSENGKKCPNFEYRLLCPCGNKKPVNKPPDKKCPPEKVWDDCAIKCDRLCKYYLNTLQEKGKCIENTKCEPGCVKQAEATCKTEQFWANEANCVNREDCLCASHSGLKIRPGATYQETTCMECQCVDNYYECDRSLCSVEEYENKNDATQPIDDDEQSIYIKLVEGDPPLPDNAFSASSSISKVFAPHMARIRKNSGSYWTPATSNKVTWLQIDLGSNKDIYGIIIKGSPIHKEFVKSYKLFYANDGGKFQEVPKLFAGSIDGIRAATYMFEKPIHAKFIQIKPQTWHTKIALRVELLGRDYEAEKKQQERQCFDEMGIGNGKLIDEQIETSSDYGVSNSKSEIRPTKSNAWKPLKNSPHEFVEFNFLEPRRIYCITTEGGPHGWVTKYSVKYSHDKKVWISITDKEFKEKIFRGNYNSGDPQTNHLDIPINAVLIRIQPINWHRNIELRVEIHGEFKPYPIDKINLIKLQNANNNMHNCNYCPGLPYHNDIFSKCKCNNNLLWDGKQCVSKSKCPCVVGDFQYSVGTVYEHECSLCICTIGSRSHCIPKKCPQCSKGLHSLVTNECGCVCLPCDENKSLCPTSNICINSELLCDGYKDCVDDEINCESNKKTESCEIKNIDSEKSIGMISTESHHGYCKNEKPLLGHKYCSGLCESSAYYNSDVQQFVSQCSSCQAVEFRPMLIEMTCNDNYKFEKEIMVPSKCKCNECNNINIDVR